MRQRDSRSWRVRESCPCIPDSEPGYMFWTDVSSSEINRGSDGWMLVRASARARTGRSAGTAMVANRSLGNPTDRDETGGLRNRMCYGSRTEASWETESITTVPYRACAPHFYPNIDQLDRNASRAQRSVSATNWISIAATLSIVQS
jgi:hypothetical protein